jgi:hypothetical protein
MPRKLVFFVCDDNNVPLPADCEIEVWHENSVAAVADSASVSRWAGHCEQAFRQKEVFFDGLSIDVFFSKDGTDPSCFLAPSETTETCSGLYHGLVAMARRRSHDDFGNAMPFAWEVRTASPRMALTREQQIEVIRAFGLFLAIATPHRTDQGFLGLEANGPSDTPYWQLVFDAFKAQKINVGAGMDMAGSLLPQWRERLIDSVADRRVKVDLTRIKQLKLDVQNGEIGAEGLFNDNRLALPMVARDGSPADSIKFSSIFYDHRVSSIADFNKVVAPWLDRVITAVGEDATAYVTGACQFVGYVQTYLAVGGADNLTDAEIQRRDAEWEDAGYTERCLAIVTYYTAARVAPHLFPRPNGQAHFCAGIGKGHDTQILNRPFTKAGNTGHVSITCISDLKRKVLQNLADPVLIFPFSPNFLLAVTHALDELNIVAQARNISPALDHFMTQNRM